MSLKGLQTNPRRLSKASPFYLGLSSNRATDAHTHSWKPRRVPVGRCGDGHKRVKKGQDEVRSAARWGPRPHTEQVCARQQRAQHQREPEAERPHRSPLLRERSTRRAQELPSKSSVWDLPLFLGKHCHSPELPSAENVLCPLLPGNQDSWAFYKLSLCWPKWLDRRPQNGPITSPRRSKRGLKHVKNNAFTHLESLPQIFKTWWVDGCMIKQVSKMLMRKLSGGYIGIYYKILSILVYLWNVSSRMLASIKMAMSHVT